MKFVLLFTMMALLCACGSQLRQPLCKEPLSEFPVELRGYYEAILPSSSTEWSENTVLESVVLEVGVDGIGTSPSLSELAAPTKNTTCRIQGRIFIESQTDNGTYHISEVAPFSHGLVYSLLTVDLKAAKKEGFPIHYLPNRNKAVEGMNDNSLSMDFNGKNLILDNSNLTPEQVISVLKPVSMQTILRRVSAPADFKANQNIRLPRKHD